MKRYSLQHLADRTLDRALDTLVAQRCVNTADLIAHVAEFDARRLYVPAGYSSMYLYCIRKLHFSEQAAYRRIHAGRTSRKFPAIFPALAEGRLHLTAVEMLAPHLTPENVDRLLAAATHKSKSEIELLLAQWFPRPDLPACVHALSPLPAGELSPARVGECGTPSPGPDAQGAAAMIPPAGAELSLARVDGLAPPAPGPVETPVPRPKVTPLSLQRFGVQFTMSQSMHDKLREAQELLSHQMPSGDIPAVLELALDALLAKLRKAKFAATDRPRRGRRRLSEGSRQIPAEVRRAVRERDGGRCTFVSDTGHRCGARKFLEFDHVDPVARGGQATIGGVRLRCRAHNQYEAERVFGAGFMSDKRERARRVAARTPSVSGTSLATPEEIQGRSRTIAPGLPMAQPGG